MLKPSIFKFIWIIFMPQILISLHLKYRPMFPGMDLDNKNLYAFSAFSVIGRMLKEGEEVEITVILVSILPLWPAQFRFLLALKLLVTTLFPLRQEFLILPQHPNLKYPQESRLRILSTLFTCSGLSEEVAVFLPRSWRPGAKL